MLLETPVEELEHTSTDLCDTILTRHLSTERPCRVLVCDDDNLVCARLAALLRASSLDVKVASSGEQALSIMNSKPCQVLLTDWQMPDMDGLDLCRIVRADLTESYVYV